MLLFPLIRLFLDVFIMRGFLFLLDFIRGLGNFLVLIPAALVLPFVDLHLLVVVLERSEVLVLGVLVVVLHIPGGLGLRVTAHYVVSAHAVFDFRGWSRLSLNGATSGFVLRSPKILTGVAFVVPTR